MSTRLTGPHQAELYPFIYTLESEYDIVQQVPTRNKNTRREFEIQHHLDIRLLEGKFEPPAVARPQDSTLASDPPFPGHQSGPINPAQ